MSFRVALATVLVSIALAHPAAAACVNLFHVNAGAAPSQRITLLSGKITYEEAQGLSGKRASVTWVDEKGTPIVDAAEVRVMRPMPVSCDGKTSGVVMEAKFITIRRPAKTMLVRLGDGAPVEFAERE